MSCLPRDDPVLRRLREGRRGGGLSLRELGAAYALLRASGHRPRRIARAADLPCSTRATLEREIRCHEVSLCDLCDHRGDCECKTRLKSEGD